MKPILFNTDMVSAILDDSKTVTRRVVKGVPNREDLKPCKTIEFGYWLIAPDSWFYQIKPPYRPGDILYVRETWCDQSGTGYPILYKADMPMHWDAEDTETGVQVDLKAEDYKWKPSIHMPREAARIFLRVTDVRVEQLYAITGKQARAEGFLSRDAFIRAFLTIW